MAIWFYRDDVRYPLCKGKFKSVDLDDFKYLGVEIPKPFLMFMWFVKGGLLDGGSQKLVHQKARSQ